jgi:hypothetical protein
MLKALACPAENTMPQPLTSFPPFALWPLETNCERGSTGNAIWTLYSKCVPKFW